MPRRSRLPRALAAAVAFTSAGALAQDVKVNRTVCERGERQQIIDVVYETGGPLPCELRVRSSKRAKPRTPWRAENEEGFCEVKAIALVQQLANKGWACRVAKAEPPKGEGAAEAQEDEPEPDVVEPAPEAAPAPAEHAAPPKENGD